MHERTNTTSFSLSAVYGKVPCLDGLRAISILIVLFSHYINAHLFPGGLGVLIFFVISGYLITRLLYAELKSGSVSLTHFYVRRFLRLYPVMLAYFTCFVVIFTLSEKSIPWIEPLSSLFYFANYLYSYFSTINMTGGTVPFASFWSLSVEEHFYIIFPAIFVFAAQNPPRFVKWLVFSIVTVLLLRLVFAMAYPEWLHTYIFYYQTQFRADSLMVGVLLAVACETVKGRHILLRLAGSTVIFWGSILMILLTLLFRDTFFRETFRYSLQSVAAAGILACLVFTEKHRMIRLILNSSPMIWVGRLSYSLYVWHGIAPTIMKTLDISVPSAFDKPIEFVFAFGLASLSYYGLERPILSLRKRFGSHAKIA